MMSDSQYFRAEGNNGGDFIEIIQDYDQAKQDVVSIRVGHCCAVSVNQEIPVELLTVILSSFFENETNIDNALKSSGWPIEYVDSLREKVRKLTYWDWPR